MRARTGYVGYDGKRKRHFARVTATHPETGERVDLKRFTKTRTEAIRKKRELLNQLERDGVESVANDRITFEVLVRKYRKERLIPAVYAGEKKIRGMRDPKAPECWVKQLLYFFGDTKLTAITKGLIEKFQIWIAKIPSGSFYDEDEKTGKITIREKHDGSQRGIIAINKPVELLRSMLNFAIEEKMLRADQNPFALKTTRALIIKTDESSRERIPSFGEEMALVKLCTRERAHLQPVIIVSSDTGLRTNEMFTLSWEKGDIDFDLRHIHLRAINAKTNKPRTIPMTDRVYVALRRLWTTTGSHPSGLVFGGIKTVQVSFDTAKRKANIVDLHKHDLRHGYVTRSILAGVPPAVVLKASGHASDEWKRYLNVGPENLQRLFEPLPGQDAAEVRAYGTEILKQLTHSFGFVWGDGMAVGMGRPIQQREIVDNTGAYVN